MVDSNFIKAAAKVAEQDRQDGVLMLVAILSRAAGETLTADRLRSAAPQGSERLGMTAF